METNTKSKKTDKSFFEDLYTLYYPTVELYILKSSGTIEDAKDIFQDAIIILLEKLEREDFVLTASLKTYIVAICKNIWLKKYRDKKTQHFVQIDETNNNSFFEEVDLFIENEKTLADKLTILMSKISSHCDRLLNKMFFFKNNSADIQKQFGYTSIHNLQKQKHKCIQQIKKQREQLEKINQK